MASCPLTQGSVYKLGKQKLVNSHKTSLLLNLDGPFCLMTNYMSLHLHLMQPPQKIVGVNFLICLGKELDPDFSKLVSLRRLMCGLLLHGAVGAGILQEPQADGNSLGSTQEKTFGRRSRVGRSILSNKQKHMFLWLALQTPSPQRRCV